MTNPRGKDLLCVDPKIHPNSWVRLSEGPYHYENEIAQITDGYEMADLTCGFLDDKVQCVGYYFYGLNHPVKLNLDLKTKIAKVYSHRNRTLVLKCDEVPPLDRN